MPQIHFYFPFPCEREANSQCNISENHSSRTRENNIQNHDGEVKITVVWGGFASSHNIEIIIEPGVSLARKKRK
jgi:hypothetical protein